MEKLPRSTAKIGEDDHADLQVISIICQRDLSKRKRMHTACHLTFSRADTLKKPPYLIWAGPPSAVVQ
jgi:hypothetical protein